MRSIYFGHTALVCLILVQFKLTYGGPQIAYYQLPNGQLRQLPAATTNCGECPAGTQREVVKGPYCGRCMPLRTLCAQGYYMDALGKCEPCPCPEAAGSRRFGTSCRVDEDGQVTCDCPSEYTGRDCSQCAPGTIQSQVPPYNCIRPNSTNSFAVQCPAGNSCPQPSIPQIVQQRPQQTQPICPFTQNQPQPQVQAQQSQPICPFTQTQVQPQPQNQVQPQPQAPPTQTQTQPAVCPVNPGTTCPTNPCGTCPTTCPTACGTNQCPINCGSYCGTCPIVQPPPTPPPTIPPWTTPRPICPGPIQCPIPTQPPICPINPGNPQCPITCPTNPGNTTCPINPPTICPQPTSPPVIPPWTTPPPPPCPGPIQCPVNPQQPCPLNPQQPCPLNPQQPCPVNPTNPCQINPTNPCQINPTNPCQITPTQPCPNPCPNPCAACPVIPPCPQCPTPICPECPRGEGCAPCPECLNPCPNPCQSCPNPCQRCPDIPECPSCNLTCPPCNPCGEITPTTLPCICDPRGTATQSGSECICKVNAQGARCDQCKKGYFGLSSTRPEGCLACFCSGLTDSCSAATYYRSILRTDRTENCTIELTNEDHTIVYSQGSAGFTFDGQTATYNKGANRRLFWSLPSCLKGDRVTSYGGYLSFTRMCTGSGSPLGADHEVMLVGGSGATIFWTTFEPQLCDGKWNQIDVLLAEPAYWSSWKDEQYRRATRADIMEVLADLQLLLIRATFTSSTLTTSIRNVTLSSVSKSRTPEGVTMLIESCRCPTGYRGLSCENCAPGYYRDTTDMSKSVFGACKPCPCSKTSEGCHLSGGKVVCKCKEGFTGPLCQDKEVITITCDPFRIREVEGTLVDFTCSFTTNSKRRLLMRLGKEGSPERAEETTSLTKTIKLTRDLRRVACEVVDDASVTWAVVYCSIELIPDVAVSAAPPPRIIAVIPSETFICVEEGESVTFSCDVHNFGQRRADLEWRREGSANLMGTGKEMTIHNCAADDSGTYICSASDGEVTGAGQIALMVRRRAPSIISMQYPVNATNPLDASIHQRHGGDYPNYPYQADEAAGNGTSSSKLLKALVGGRPTSTKINSLPPGHPKVFVEPAEVFAKPGETVIIRCNATGQEPLKFYWKSGTSDYIPVHVRVSHGALIFRHFRNEDIGSYYCVAWNKIGQASAKATISLDVASQQPNTTVAANVTGPPTIEILHPEISARPGENVNFQCRSNTTGVTYKWVKLGERMPNSSEIRNDGLLTLYRVSESNKGTYMCTVTSPTGEKTSANAVLKLKPIVEPAEKREILVPPRIAIRPKSPLRVRTGSKVRIECESLGNPLPNVTWVRSIDGTEKRLVTTSINKAIYEIKQMTTSDVGKYTCNAVNSAGKKSESMSIVIDDGLPCKESEFRCKSNDQCIPKTDRCDDVFHCKDKSDEANCKGKRRVRRQPE